MKCNKCKENNYPIDLSYNETYGWVCKSCAKETNTAFNLFIKKRKQYSKK